MKITRENYELFLVDYLDGNLPKQDQDELMHFLAQHKDLAEEFSLLNNSVPLVLNQDKAIEKVDFTYLKKEEQNWIAADEMIAALEGDLSETDHALFERKLVLYPQNKVTYELFLKTKLVPQELVFEHKASLKKKTGLSFAMYANYLAIAATLLLVGFLGLMYNSNFNQSKVALASKEITSKRSEPKTVEAIISIDGSVDASNQNKVKKLAFNEQTKKPLEFEVRGEKEGENKGINQFRKTQELSAQKLITRTENIIQLPSRNLHKELENKLALADVNSALSLPNIKQFNLKQKGLSNETVIGSDQAVVQQTPYLNPADWLKQKMKTRMPVALNTIDTLKQGGARIAGTYAMQLVEKTTGISYQETHDATTERSGFAIISKYFAYERNYKTEKY